MANYIFGIRPVIEALKSGKEIDKVLVKKNLTGSLVSELYAELKKNGLKAQFVPAERIDKISKANNQGVVAYVSPISYYDLEDLLSEKFDEEKNPLIIILDGVTDVRNFGAISRTAECMGADAIVIPRDNSVRVTEDAIKTSAGALYNIPVCKVENLVDTVILVQQMGLNVVAASEKSYKNLFESDLKQPTAIVMGAEDKGVSQQLIRRIKDVYKIPTSGKTDSLNVSVAAGMFLYEALRQRSE